jgi:hypothetical protein
MKHEISRRRRREALELVKQEEILDNSYASTDTLTHFRSPRFWDPGLPLNLRTMALDVGKGGSWVLLAKQSEWE